MAWVVDPQKYADGVLHERYLRPLRRARGDDARRPQPGRPARRGGGARPAWPTWAGCSPPTASRGCRCSRSPRGPARGSTRCGRSCAGASPRARPRSRGSRPTSARAAAALAGGGRRDSRGGSAEADRAALTAALAGAAGVPAVVRAVARSHRRTGALATGWPYVRWVRRFAPDPLRRLRLAGGERPAELGAGPARTSLPEATPVQRATVETAARALADRAAGDLPAPWPGLARRAALSQEDDARRATWTPRSPARSSPGGAPRWWRVAGAAPARCSPSPRRPARCGCSRWPGWGTCRSTTSCPRRRSGGSRCRPRCSAAGRSRGCSLALLARARGARGRAAAGAQGRAGAGAPGRGGRRARGRGAGRGRARGAAAPPRGAGGRGGRPGTPSCTHSFVINSAC